MAVALAASTLVVRNTSTVHAGSLKRTKVTLPVGTKPTTTVAVSVTGVPTGPPGEGVAKIDGNRFRTVKVKV